MSEQYCPTCDKSFEEPLERCPSDGTKLVVIAEDSLVGRELDGRFTLKERLGAGGMGTVYRGIQHSVGRAVAVKVMHARPGDPVATAKRFMREATLASRLSQPNVVAVIDFGQTRDGLLFLAMELIEGRTLADVIKSEGPFSVERTIRIALQVCDALEAAHRLSIVHRDLKPANVMVLDEPRGRDLVKVVDFGLAKTLDDDGSRVTSTGVIVGTPGYLAPEMVMGGPVDERADLYALGVMLCTMLSGETPFAEAETPMVVAHQVYGPQPTLPPSVPAVLQNVVLKLLDKDPDARHRNAAQVRMALEEVGRVGGAPVAREQKKIGRWALAVGGVVVLAGGALLLRPRERPPEPIAPVAVAPSPSPEPVVVEKPPVVVEKPEKRHRKKKEKEKFWTP